MRNADITMRGVLVALEDGNPQTAAGVAAEVGYSVRTVSTYLRGAVKRGLVRTVGTVELDGPGRPPFLYALTAAGRKVCVA